MIDHFERFRAIRKMDAGEVQEHVHAQGRAAEEGGHAGQRFPADHGHGVAQGDRRGQDRVRAGLAQGV